MGTKAKRQLDVVTAVIGDDCQFCDPGSLEQQTYKGKRAAVCDHCGTPQIQTW